MPVTAAAVAGGTQLISGLGQALFSGRKKAEADLNAFTKQNPLAQESPSISNYYQNALNRYQENPYNSAPYLISRQEADRRLMSSIGALQDRKSAIGGISKLDLMRTDAQNQAIRNAEAMKGQQFSQLGQATQMQNAQDRYLFDVNKLTPYNRMFGLKQYGAEAANQRYNAGLQMVGGALGNAAQIGAMSAYNKPVTQDPQTGTSSQYIFNSYMENPSLKPQLDTSLIQKTGVPQRNPYISPASVYFPSAY